jgi:hypothetical protein
LKPRLEDYRLYFGITKTALDTSLFSTKLARPLEEDHPDVTLPDHPVRHGGLDDTVEQYNEATGEGTGFKFWDASPHGIYYTVGWAVSTYYDRREHFDEMRQRAMAQRFSWEDSAQEYEKLYQRAIDAKAQ